MKALGGDPQKINPLVPSIWSAIIRSRSNFFANNTAVKKNVDEEYRRTGTLRISQVVAEVVRHFRVVRRDRHLPPGQSRIPLAGGLDQEG